MMAAGRPEGRNFWMNVTAVTHRKRSVDLNQFTGMTRGFRRAKPEQIAPRRSALRPGTRLTRHARRRPPFAGASSASRRTSPARGLGADRADGRHRQGRGRGRRRPSRCFDRAQTARDRFGAGETAGDHDHPRSRAACRSTRRLRAGCLPLRGSTPPGNTGVKAARRPTRCAEPRRALERLRRAQARPTRAGRNLPEMLSPGV